MAAKKEREPNDPSFEESLAKLEGLVAKLEAGDTPLAELVAKFEEGSKLLASCEAQLRAAELRIEQLRRDQERTTLEPMDLGEDPAN